MAQAETFCKANFAKDSSKETALFCCKGPVSKNIVFSISKVTEQEDEYDDAQDRDAPQPRAAADTRRHVDQVKLAAPWADEGHHRRTRSH